MDMIDDETDEEDENELVAEEEWGEREFVSDLSGDDDDRLSDLEKIADEDSLDESDDDTSEANSPKTLLGKRKAAPPLSRRRPEKQTKKGPRLEVEYETEVNAVPLARSSW